MRKQLGLAIHNKPLTMSVVSIVITASAVVANETTTTTITTLPGRKEIRMYGLKVMDHIEYPKTLKSKDNSSLRFIINDCQQAIAAMPNNPNCAYYGLEIYYCSEELASRDAINPDNL